MNAWNRFSQWLCSTFFFQAHDRPPLADPELHELADRVEDIEAKNAEQDRRLSVVEVKVGVRQPEWHMKRDAG